MLHPQASTIALPRSTSPARLTAPRSQSTQTWQDPPLVEADFQQKIEQEFIQGSGIAPDLFDSAIEIVPSLRVLPGRDAEVPIHDALNWSYVRFGQQTQPSFFAALFRNEDDSYWQAKLSQPKLDRDKTRKALRQHLGRAIRDDELDRLAQQYPDCAIVRKYETPVGNGSRAFLPPMSLGAWRAIAQRYHLPEADPWLRNKTPYSFEVMSLLRQGFLKSAAALLIPLLALTELLLTVGLEASVKAMPDRALVPQFWDYVSDRPEIPIVWTEGGKKGLSLLSQGYVAIALYGVNGGYRAQDKLGNRIAPELIPDVVRFATPQRHHILAFDQDAKPETRLRVGQAIHRFGGLLSKSGTVAIALWQEKQGKGVDDLIVQQGIQAWEQAYQAALSLHEWRIWQRLDSRLTFPAQLEVDVADLSHLNIAAVPEQGILAIASAKGTGKTKLINQLIQGLPKVLAATHRIALGRNTSARLGIDWRGDIDKVQGEFFNGSGYTLRVGFCVDSLLAINPEQFAGCDLVVDELVQVLRHLLTSSTCAKDGKRPALLARFRELVRIARRVIVADADLDNASLHYLQSLRADDRQVFLVRNTYQPQPYNVQFIQAPDRSAILVNLFDALTELPPDQTIFVATDSKGLSKAIAQMIAKACPEKRLLLINSETSGGKFEQDFMKAPDEVLSEDHYDLIVASPSVGTGLSIEIQGAIAKVFGIFTGVSSTAADMMQSLMRVREPVDRVVWCMAQGRNYCTVSRSLNAIEIKRQLQDRTNAIAAVTRSNLRADVVGAIDSYDWQADPQVNLWSRISAEQNFSMLHLRDELLMRLRYEGHKIKVEQQQSDGVCRFLLQEAREELKQLDAEQIVSAKVLSFSEVLQLEQKESLSPEEHQAIARHALCEFYCLEPEELSTEFVLWDNNGRRRGELLNLEAQLYPGASRDRLAQILEKQMKWNQGLCPWDIPGAELRRRLREKIKLEEMVRSLVEDPEQVWTEYDIEEFAEQARKHAPQIQAILKFTIKNEFKPIDADDPDAAVKPVMSDVQVVHQLLSQLGIRIYKPRKGEAAQYQTWSRSVEGHEGEKLRLYRLDPEHWQQIKEILDRRQQRREGTESLEEKGIAGSPVDLEDQLETGDPELDGDRSIFWVLWAGMCSFLKWVELETESSPCQLAIGSG